MTFSLHKSLLRGFFCNARCLLIPYGEIHVRHKTGGPYDKWDLEQLALDSSHIMVEKEKFQIADYPGYNQKRGDGARSNEPFPLGPSCTFKFQIGDCNKWKESSRNKATSTSFLGGSNSHPSGKLGTDTRLLHQLPHVQAWPWPHFTPQPYIVAQATARSSTKLGWHHEGFFSCTANVQHHRAIAQCFVCSRQHFFANEKNCMSQSCCTAGAALASAEKDFWSAGR